MADNWEKITQKLYEHDNYRRMAEVYGFINKTVHSIPGKDLQICDIGCGDGSLLELVKDKGKLYGVDVSRTQLKQAVKKGIKASHCNLDMSKLPFKDGIFDAVISSEVIEHVLVPDKLLTEAKRVLKADGIFILTTPNLASFGKRLLLLFNQNPYIECSPFEPDAVGHLRYYIYPTLLKQVERFGFRLVQHTSDVINFESTGKLNSRLLARLFPTFGRTLIFVLKKA